MSYFISKNDFGMTPIIISNSVSLFLICVVVAIILGTILYFTFMNKENEFKFSGFLGKLYSFLTFKSFIFEDALKLIYILGASFFTIYGLSLLFVSPVLAFMILVGSNLVLRLTFEFLISIFRIKDNKCDCFNDFDYDYDDYYFDDDFDCDGECDDCNHANDCYGDEVLSNNEEIEVENLDSKTKKKSKKDKEDDAIKF